MSTSRPRAQVTPFSVVTDDTTGNKYPLADYALTPSMAIIDANVSEPTRRDLVSLPFWIQNDITVRRRNQIFFCEKG